MLILHCSVILYTKAAKDSHIYYSLESASTKLLRLDMKLRRIRKTINSSATHKTSSTVLSTGPECIVKIRQPSGEFLMISDSSYAHPSPQSTSVALNSTLCATPKIAVLYTFLTP